MLSTAFCVFLLTTLATAAGKLRNGRTSEAPKLLVIMLDGFRWDYLARFDTPNFDFMVRTGVKAEHLEPVYPTNTIPNIYTQYTGLYPESHGMVNNYFYDPGTKFTFNLNYAAGRTWVQAETIRETAARWGKRLVHIPAVIKESLTEPTKERARTAVDLLVNDTADIVWFYSMRPDYLGHLVGPNSKGLMVPLLDEVMGHILANLRKHGSLNRVNVMVFADHGLADVPNENGIDVPKCLGGLKVAAIFTGTAGNVYVDDDSVDAAFSALDNCHPNMTAYRKQDVPERFHYSNNQRIGQIVLMADEGWYGYTEKDFSSYLTNARHGYDNKLPSMQAIFMARGPSFKVNYTASSFSMIHLYSLICHVTGIQPAPNNGSLSETKEMLIESRKFTKQ